MNAMSRVRRLGFTMVEVLVVIAVLGVLMGLLLPAIQAAREAARRSDCGSKIKQLALACQMFHNAEGRLPPGQCGGEFKFGPDSRCWSWLSRILPFVEQESLYRQGGIPNSTFRQSIAPPVQVPLFLCPSDSFSQTGPRRGAGNFEDGKTPLGQTNYKGVSGANWGADETQHLENIDTLWRNQGTHGSSYDGQSHGDGVMWRNDIRFAMTFAKVRDGLSFTFLVGEDLPERNLWCSWPYSTHAYGTCAIPPNYTYSDPSRWENTLSFRSAHPGGLNFALADGSTHFVSDKIALEVYRAWATRDGNESVADLK
jgi:prepilin-type N-terminal cleavage/methylation domain-containing protein/prepilin-type processing-associated H-X9-DG protein